MPDSDVDFDPEADLDASGRHAEVRQEGRQYLLIDAGSRNGTWLNGERVRHAVLKEGDEVEFGKGGPVIVVLEVEHEPSQKPRPLRQTSGKIVRTETDIVPETVSHEFLKSMDIQPTNPNATLPRRPDNEFEFPPRKHDRQAGSRWIWFVVALFGVTALAFVGVLRKRAPDTEVLAKKVAAAAGAQVRASTLHIQAGDSPERCSAFYVQPKIAVTTARCVSAVRKAVSASAKVDVKSLDGDKTEIVRMWRHPGFVEAQSSPDVALIELSKVGPPIALAEGNRGSIEPGDRLYVFDAKGTALPVAVDSLASLARGESGDRSAIVHRASVVRGSPLVDERGAVVGIQAGVLPGDPFGRAYAVRVELARGLLAGLEQSHVF